ncbi:YdaS family helix-turn-helix protein [Janthinobacterium sp. HLS12-2]|uniref:YdaS family helix-turn-helix protein n=1 Tax=Janthinobacterium sp. HLS12-2 TaxID=1259324 RepID=UPI003F26C13C
MDAKKPTPIERAVQIAGGAIPLADACGVSFQAVYKWIKRGHPPTERCASVEAAVGGAVTRFELLPPTFGEQKRRQASRATDPIPPLGRSGRQPPSTNNIFDSVPDHSVVLPTSYQPPDSKP